MLKPKHERGEEMTGRAKDNYASDCYGQGIKILMQERGLSYFDVAKVTDIQPSSLSRYVNGTSSIPLRAAARLAKFFNTDMHKILEKGGYDSEQDKA